MTKTDNQKTSLPKVAAIEAETIDSTADAPEYSYLASGYVTVMNEHKPFSIVVITEGKPSLKSFGGLRRQLAQQFGVLETSVLVMNLVELVNDREAVVANAATA